MTDEERWKIEGRTREAFRDAKKNVAALKIEIEDYAKRLEQAAGSLRHFLSNPVGKGPTGMSGRQYMVHFYHEWVSLELERKLREFEEETTKVETLESQIKDFD